MRSWGAIGALAALLAVTPGASAQDAEPDDAPSLPIFREPSPASPPPPAAKAMPDTIGEAVGTWDLSFDGTNRRCVLTFASETGPNGRILRFPAGCRRALPILNSAVGWLFTSGSIRLVDANVRPLLEFTRRPDGHSQIAVAERGGTYSLVPLQIEAMSPGGEGKPEGEQSVALEVASPREIPGSQPVLPANVLVPKAGQPAAGIYALDRFSEKDVCRIELGQPSATPVGKDAVIAAQARILPGCRDSGIAVFDPETWRFANGHMTLRSKRGHVVNLIPIGDGRWRRDPDIGSTFILRKTEP